MGSLQGTVIDALSYLVLGGQVIVLILLTALVFRKNFEKSRQIKKYLQMVSENYVTLILIVSAAAVIGSLTLSEIVNFTPCKLCWYQRIFMYPVAIISLMALIFNERVKKFILALSSVGILISIYHILMQVFPKAFECNDEVAKCTAVQFAQFGYITIPVMSFTAFAIIILLSLLGREK